MPPGNLEGAALRTWFKTNWFDSLHTQLGYLEARRKLYNFIDNHNNTIVDAYSGFVKTWTYGGTGTNPQPINCEHTVPQSYFAYAEPMKSDLHHLFPVHSSTNSSRSNHPFGEIDNNLTSKWWFNGTSQTTIPTSGIDDFSEYYSGTFEPREDHKGNAARAVFYFYTMYPTQAGNITQIGDLEVLYKWHLSDPVDPDEIMRNDLIEAFQGDRNPYIDFPELVAIAWGLTPTSQELYFSEYVEGSSYNKALEIYNGTGGTVDLAGYSLKKQTNGSGNWSSGLNLSGSLNPGEVFVVAHPSASSTVLNQSDLISSNSTMSFNGNDPIGLFHDGVLIDIIGDFNGGTTNFAANTTLRRISSVTEPASTYLPSDWDSYPSNTFAGLGSHGSAKTGAVWSATEENVSETNIYPNPFQHEFFVQLPAASVQSEAQVELLDLT
ncbi:MAG: endonuclease, partial [Bacteroidota bacterium]